MIPLVVFRKVIESLYVPLGRAAAAELIVATTSTVAPGASEPDGMLRVTQACVLAAVQFSAELPVLRRGHAVAWIEDALSPLRSTHPHIDTHRLAVAIRAATGIESFVWLVDVAGVTRPEVAEILCGTAQALLAKALAGPGECFGAPARRNGDE